MTPPYSQGGTSDIRPLITAPGERVARIDWLTFTTRQPVEAVLTALDSAFGGDCGATRMNRGLYGYHDGYMGLGGSAVNWTEGRDEVCVVLPGGACSLLDGPTLVALGVGLGASVSRIDVAVDGCPFTPRDVRDAWMDGNAVSKVQRSAGDRLTRSHEWIESPTGQTFYLGSPQSDRRSRCYTKLDDPVRLLPDGTPIVRWETQYRNDRAKTVWRMLGDTYNADPVCMGGLPGMVLGLIADHVRFTDPVADKNVSRRPTVAWWQAFIGAVERVKTWLPTSLAATFQQLEQYLFKQVSGAFAAFLQHVRLSGGCRAHVIDQLVQNGNARMGPRHRALLVRQYGRQALAWGTA